MRHPSPPPVIDGGRDEPGHTERRGECPCRSAYQRATSGSTPNQTP